MIRVYKNSFKHVECNCEGGTHDLLEELTAAIGVIAECVKDSVAAPLSDEEAIQLTVRICTDNLKKCKRRDISVKSRSPAKQ